MAFKYQNTILLLGIYIVWKFQPTTAYLDICESTLGTAYCRCEESSFRQFPLSYHVSCVILRNISEHDPLWRSIGDGDSISSLKLHPSSVNTLECIPSEDLRRMTNLKILKIEQATLHVLRAYALSEMNLIELELEGNEITSMESNAISNMPHLKKLTLSNNLLQELLADTLNGLDSLESLFLDRNNISRIETCAFCNLQDLKDLDLWGNQISDLTEYTFKGLRYVTRLDLSRNKIRILSDKVFHMMPRLVELDLRENMISYIASRAFFGLEKLQSLALGKNNIKVLPNEIFVPLQSIMFVDLFKNELEVIQKEVVYGVNGLSNDHFAIGFIDNPLKCDCAWLWIPSFLKTNTSHRFVRELQAANCTMDNKTKVLIVDYLKKIDCKTSTIKPRTPVVIPSIATQTSENVPNELSIQKNVMKVEHSSKSVATAAVADDETESYLRDVEEGAGADNSATHVSDVMLNLFFCLSLIILHLTRSQRKL